MKCSKLCGGNFWRKGSSSTKNIVLEIIRGEPVHHHHPPPLHLPLTTPKTVNLVKQSSYILHVWLRVPLIPPQLPSVLLVQKFCNVKIMPMVVVGRWRHKGGPYEPHPIFIFQTIFISKLINNDKKGNLGNQWQSLISSLRQKR